MRISILVLLALGAISVAAPAQAQTYDPDYPVCLEVYGPTGRISCSYTSLAQCSLSSAGRPAQCIVNPYYANAYQSAPRPRYRRHRHHH